MTINTWTMDVEQLESHSNKVKDLILEELLKRDLINEFTADDLSRKLHVIIKKPSLLSKFFKDKEMRIMISELTDSSFEKINKL